MTPALISLLFPLVLAAVPAGSSPSMPDLPATSARVDPSMTFDEVTARLSSRPLHRVEGVWMFPADGGMVAIERDPDIKAPAVEYLMRIVSSSNRMLLPGTVIGRLRPTAKPETFAARLYTKVHPVDETLGSPAMFTLHLTHDDSRLELRHHRKGVRLNWWRLLPYMYRGLIRPFDETPRDLDGCVRVYPEPAIPANPRYL